MDILFTAATFARRGLLAPGRPDRIAQQLAALLRWGYGLGGEIRAAAARDPQQLAIVDDRGRLTYAELLDRSQRLAAALRDAYRVAAGHRIGLLCRNSGGLIEAMAAASMLGADAVLINTGLSPAQMASVAREQTLRVLIHDPEFAEHAATLPRGVAHLDSTQADELVHKAGRAAIARPEREGRTIVLTSGTTGVPKGAQRRTPDGFGPLATIISRIPLRPRQPVLIAAPLFHTWGYAGLQVALGLRATIVLQRRFEPEHALDALARVGGGGLFAVPVMLQRLLDVRARRGLLRVVAVSGSALPGGLATRFMDAFGDVLYNLYGSTEASWVSIATPTDLRQDPQTAGRPPHGTRLRILSHSGKAMPAGQTGRIFVVNDMLFEGYTNGATQEMREGLLATGDLGHLDRDGLLYVDGRVDDMVISGGENVFPSEVENLLARLPQVREVAVIGVPDAEFGQRLAAWIAPRPGVILDADEVREYVRSQLARFSVPRDVHFVDALPRNATGKVVPRELPGR
ncbi:MAG TPA: AMP-binding protein [Rugosimonospora sp.]|nr:AMP-binding protein [Rugosimonospora sp.]